METLKNRRANPPPGQRFILDHTSWKTYESLLADHEGSSAPRFAYDGGVLEILSPNPQHERTNRDLAMIVEVFFEEWGVDIGNFGSTTFRREDLRRGFEPDSCFYIANEAAVRGKEGLDLATDPPPDLVIGVDLSSFSLNKLPLYAGLGVPEVWRYDGQRLDVLLREGEGYEPSARSRALPGVSAEVLSNLLEESKTSGRTGWLKKVREAAREALPEG